jgi:hypothetical protein
MLSTSPGGPLSLVPPRGRAVFATVGLLAALSLAPSGCSSTPGVAPSDGGLPVSTVEISGPTSLDLGAEAIYSAVARDKAGQAVAGAAVTWVASGTVALSTPTMNTGPSTRVRATALGPAAVTAMSGGRSAQIAINVHVGAATLSLSRADGSPFPNMIAIGQQVAIKAQYTGAGGVKTPAPDAAWSGTGDCTLLGTIGAMITIQGDAAGQCSVTVTAMGKSAVANFAVVQITSVKVTGDTTSALKLGATRKLTAVAVFGTTDVPTVPVSWMQTGAAVAITTASNVATVTGAAVGPASLLAVVTGTNAMTPVSFAVEPVSLELSAATTRILAGGGTRVTVTARDASGAAGKFAVAQGVALTGTAGFDAVSAAAIGGDGLVTFVLGGATADSPLVQATFGAVTSNALAFTIVTAATVSIVGPVGPAPVGSSLDLSLMVKDAQGAIIGGGAPTMWADASGVLVVPAQTQTDDFKVTATVAKLGTSSLVATVGGVASPAYAVPGVPGGVVLSAFVPTSVPVGGAAVATATAVDTNGVVIPAVTAAEVTATSADPTMVSVGAAVAAGDGFQFSAMGVALTPDGGVGVSVTWSNGTESVTSAAVPLIVSP